MFKGHWTTPGIGATSTKVRDRMIRISGLGAKNLRSMKLLQPVLFKPINILVGRNSAGKSTFARLLPLLKQSSERRKRSPILWWGRLVDFGTFDDVYSSFSTDNFIDLIVTFETDRALSLTRRFNNYRDDPSLGNPAQISATFRLVKADDGVTVLRELHLDVFEVKVVLGFSDAGDVSVWAAGGFKDTLLRWKMKPEVDNGNEKAIQPRVQA